MKSQIAAAPELSLIVPTYNEGQNIARLIKRVHKSLSNYSYELIVVDDDSPDGTSELAKRMAQEYPVRVVVRKNSRGISWWTWGVKRRRHRQDKTTTEPSA